MCVAVRVCIQKTFPLKSVTLCVYVQLFWTPCDTWAWAQAFWRSPSACESRPHKRSPREATTEGGNQGAALDARDETVETKKGCRNEKRQPHAEGLGSVWTAAEETAARVQSQTPRQQFDKREPWLCWQQWISQHSGSLPSEPRLSVSMCDESLQCCMCLKLPGPGVQGLVVMRC